MGKTAGRWTKEEHKKFVQGKKILNIFKHIFNLISFSYQTLWKGLEKSGRICFYSFWCIDQISCLEVLYKNSKKIERELSYIS
jgi:hypothetical protein